MSSSSSRQPPLPPPRKAPLPLAAAPESSGAAAEKSSSPMMARSAPVPVPLGTRRRGALYRSARLLHDSGEHAIVGAPLPLPPASPPPVMPYNSTSSSLSSATSPHHRRLSPTRSQGTAPSSNSTTPPSKSSAETLRETIARFTGASPASTITGSPVVDAISGKSTPDGMGSVEDVARRSRTSTLSSGCMSCGGGVCGALSTSSSAHTGQLQRANRPGNIILKEQLAAKLSTPAECICVPPVLLSPVLSRPLRSQSAASSPLPTRTLGSDSDGDISVIWRSAASRRSQGIERHGSRTNTPTMSPILNRSTSASKLAASFANRSSSGSSLLSARNLLRRTDSDAAEQQRRQRQRRGKRRPSFLSHGMCSETSVDSCSSSSSNLARLRTSLGHSDPQISASIHSSLSQQQQSAAATTAGGGVGGGSGAPLPAVRLRKDVLSLSSRGARHSAARRSLNASTSPVLAPRCRSPAGRQLLPTAPVGAASAASTSGAPSGGSRSTATVPLRSYSTRSGSNLMAPPAHDNRRWSLASLPSTSGYGTPGSNSAFSSQYSSSEQLNELLDSLRLGGGGGGPSSARFDSNDSSAEDPFGASGGPGSSSGVHLPFRPRSRSLTSPIKLGSSEWSVDIISRNSVYKERFPRAKHQMEERLATFIAENAPLSGGASCGVAAAPENEEEGGGGENSSRASSRRSMVLTAETTIDPSLLRLIADGATRFLHHQLVEIASDCLGRSRDDTITCSYFCEMSQRLDETLAEAQQKTCGESCVFLSILVKQLLMIVSRPARLLECLEFDPDEFYHLLEEAEGVVREQLGSGSARVPDLPQYIIGKLGLDRDPLLEEDGRGVGGHSPPPTPAPPALGASGSSGDHQATGGAEAPQKQWPNNRAPCEDDLESIRLVSNGAYGAVYLVRHRETRQRFALKKMNKQTLMLRNQIDQVFAERDILTMTDNPFVVSFYGSFETRHHLCMLMEYVEGGDCAALLKKAGTLPIDLARLYVAETILAIEYLHSYGVVHRDLKPDNLLITAMGHIKLTDFGLSKIGLMNRTTLVCEGFEAEAQQFKDKQLCGTPEYIAPEVILRQGYGKPVDWWALGVITYEFLVGCVPFFGESPEDLFSKVISEEVEYPDGEEALPVAAEHLIRALLEKNPVERLGSLSGASQLMAHDFFAGLDFNTLLRQKAEFVPQLENDEDTSYFDSRSDRYNHEAESCGEDEAVLAAAAPMFHSFSTASPRHSIVGLGDGPLLPPERISAVLAAQQQQHEAALPPTASPSPTPSSVLARAHSNRKALASANSSEDHSTTDSLNDAEKFVSPIPSAVLLRRRFSAARASNLSTSSSGTTGTGGCGGRGGSAVGSGAFCGTAPSSTDSSIDASFAFLDRRHTHGEEARRHDSGSTVASSLSRRSPLPRFAISCDPDEDHSSQSSLPTSAKMCQSQQQQQQMVHELSPVDEAAVRPRSSLDRVSHALQLVIPSSGASVSSSSTPSHGGGHPPSLPSPGACSATSSLEGGGGPSHHSSSSFISPHALHHADASGSLVACSQAAPLSPSLACLKAPIVMRKGTFGFGFTIRSVRVYLAEHSDYYTIEHIVAAVDEGGPAFEAGLRADDMITHVNNQPVHNLTHPQLMHLILAYGNEIALKVIPMAATSIREGAPRKSVGKLAKRKPSRPSAARRVQLDKKPRKASSLLRRLSGKRPPAETFVPGSSSQKQTFMPRSVSSQDGAILQQPGTSSGCSGGVCCSQQACTASSHHQDVPSSPTVAATSSASGGKRLSDVGLREEHRSPLVGCSSPSSSFSATTWSAFGPASPAAAASGTSTSNNSSSRPSTLTGLRPKSLSATLPRLSAVVTASTTASQSCSIVVGGAAQPGGGGPQAPPVTAPSPIPVSPLARLPSPTRPLSPHHHQNEQQQQHVHYHYNTTPPALPHPPEGGQSTQTRNATALRHHADSAPPPQAPPPPPPPPQSLSQAAPAAARNLMNRLLNKDVAPK